MNNPKPKSWSWEPLDIKEKDRKIFAILETTNGMINVHNILKQFGEDNELRVYGKLRPDMPIHAMSVSFPIFTVIVFEEKPIP